MKATRLSLILLAAAGLAGVAIADGVKESGAGSAQAAPAKPWVKNNDCSWWLSRADGKSHHASIEQSADGVSFGLSDPAFMTWSESERPKVELRFNRDPKRRVVVRGWVSRGKDFAMVGLYLNAAALRKIAGATTLELRRHGKLIVELPLASTPNRAELEACIPPPLTGPSDSE